jgi:hypothetical protein
MSIGLIINYTRYITYFDITQDKFICDDLNQAKNFLINYIVSKFLFLNIDFPLDLLDLEYLVFDNQYINTNIFTYDLFINNKWEKPWELQEIYNDVLSILQEKENNKNIDFSQLYSEPNPDENLNNNFVENENNSELTHIINNIIDESKNIKLTDNFVKECKCEKCLR